MKYESLSKEDFDAIVTGELTHYAIWLEDELIKLISHYFSNADHRKDFERLLLRRDGLTFQDKIEIVRAMMPLFSDQEEVKNLKNTLNKIEDFKANRNAFAHGMDVTPNEAPPGEIQIEVVTRSGKEKIVTITPESHRHAMSEAEELLKQLQDTSGKLRA